MSNIITGNKYEATKYLNIVEIAKLIRKDLKEAFEEYKFNVQVEKYSMGCSLHIQIHDTNLDLTSSDGIEASIVLQKAVRDIAYEYNRSEVDLISDYHDTKFYAHDVRVKS